MSGLAEALAEHRHFTYNLTAERVLCAGCDWSGEIDADRTAHLADVAHRWYTERLGSDDVREAVARAIVAHADEPMWSAMVIARHALTALRAALTERGAP